MVWRMFNPDQFEQLDSFGPRVIEFMDGPFAGTFHEVHCGWPCPSAIGKPLDSEDRDAGQAWYDIDEWGRGWYRGDE
jgi:hypothetical protein